MASVDQILASAQLYASNIQSQASAAVTATLAAVAGVQGPAIPDWNPATYGVGVKDSTGRQTLPPEVPTSSSITLHEPVEPSADIDFQPISGIVAGPVPVLTAVAPELTYPSTPSQLPEFQGTGPIIATEFTFPTAPSILTSPFPTAPTVGAYAAPSRPTTTTPTLDEIAPSDAPEFQGDARTITASAYHEAAPEFITMINGYVDAQLNKINPQYSTQMAAIETQLSKYLAGGTGLKTEVEDAIYARAQAKNDVEAKRVQDAAFADNAARGFTMPGGALMSALARARQDAANNNAKQATDIAVAQAEMEQKNLQFAVTTSTGLRTAVVNATMSYMQNVSAINGQALGYAKDVLAGAIEMYNVEAKQFGMRLEVYKTSVAAYSARMQGAQVTAELYRADIAALESLVGVDRARIDAYKAQIDGVQSIASVYKSQIEATLGAASLEKLKLEMFQTQVQAYSSLVQAKQSEWQGFTAAMGGREAAARIYTAQVEGYKALVEGYKVGIEAQAETIRAQASSNQAIGAQARAKVDVFDATVRARATIAGFALEQDKQKTTKYQVESNAWVQQLDSSVKLAVGMTQAAAEVGKVRQAAVAEQLRSDTTRMQTIAGVSSITATTLSGMAQAAMSGMNVLAAQTETI